MNEPVAALAWYSETEYLKFLNGADDPEVWDQDYNSWRSKAEDLIADLAGEGTEVVKIPLTLEETREWCRSQGKPNVAASRSQLAALKGQGRK